MTDEDFSLNRDKSQTRAALYKWLSSLFLNPPTPEIVQILKEKTLSSLLLDSGQVPLPKDLIEGIRKIEELASSFGQSHLQEIAVDFTRLFRGINKKYSPPPPYQSVYLEKGLVMGKSTMDVKKIYQEAGITLADEFGGEPPDHIAFEFEFMSFLCRNESAAWESGDTDRAYEIIRSQNDFIQQNLVSWVPQFCDRIIEDSRCDFYRWLAKCGKEFVISEHESMREQATPLNTGSDSGNS